MSDKYPLKCTTAEVMRNIVVPSAVSQIPRIVGWCGPARSGTTALLLLLAKHPAIQFAYFQPITTLYRLGSPTFTIHPSSGTICLKETFWSMSDKWMNDPIEILMRSGIPQEKIKWIFTLREPALAFGSWRSIEPSVSIDSFIWWYNHTVTLYAKYSRSGVVAVPFPYDLCREDELRVINRLLPLVGLDEPLADLTFDEQLIREKLTLGQAADEEYFKKLIRPILARGQYSYTSNTHVLTAAEALRIYRSCNEQYLYFIQEMRDRVSGL